MVKSGKNNEMWKKEETHQLCFWFHYLYRVVNLSSMKLHLLTLLVLISCEASGQQSITLGIGGQMAAGRRITINSDFELSGGHSWNRTHTYQIYERNGATASLQGTYIYDRFFVPITAGLQIYKEEVVGNRTITVINYSGGYHETDIASSDINYSANSVAIGVSTGFGFNILKVNRKEGRIGVVVRLNPSFNLSRSIRSNSVNLNSSHYNSAIDSTTFTTQTYEGARDFVVYPSDLPKKDPVQLRPSIGLSYTTEIGDQFGLSFEFDYLMTPVTYISFGEHDLQSRINLQLHFTYYLYRKN